MLLAKFLATISKIVPGDVLSGKEDAIASLNPDKFYVEDVRSVLGVSNPRATQICESAVRQGLFRRGIQIMCPDGSVAASADSEAGLPPTVHCWEDEGGHLEEVEKPTVSLSKLIFYSLNDKSTSVLYK
jgi:hypothetical protein